MIAAAVGAGLLSLVACSGGDQATDVSTTGAPITAATATVGQSTAPASPPAVSPSVTAASESAPAAEGRGEEVQATFDAMLAAYPDHPQLAQVMIVDEQIQAVLYADPVTDGYVALAGYLGEELTETPWWDDSVSGPVPVIPAAGLDLATHWDAAHQIKPECQFREAHYQALHNGVLGSRFRCDEALNPHYAGIGDVGFQIMDDYLTPEGIDQAFSMMAIAGLDEMNNFMLTQDQISAFIPQQSVALTDGSTCGWVFMPLMAASRCKEPGSETFSLSSWNGKTSPILAEAFTITDRVGFFPEPGFSILVDSISGENVLQVVTGEMEFLQYLIDGTPLHE